MFLNEIERFSKIIKPLIKQKAVRVIAHHDADGLCGASIIMKMLLRADANFELKVFKQLTADAIDSLRASENDFIIFIDFGSGQLPALKDILDRTHVLVIDHHEPLQLRHLNLFHLNPLIFGEDEISSSMLCYLVAKAFDIKNTDLIDLAIVGAVADEQDEKWEFKGLARKILREADVLGKVSVTKGLRLYGRNTRPIHKSLEYSFDPIIPGISGSESQAVQFLSELGISVKSESGWRMLKDLSVEEQRKLASAIIMERLKFKHADNADIDAADIFGEVYTILGRPEELQDAREFATLINACGRTGNLDTAIRLSLGDPTAVTASWHVLDRYRRLISNSLNWIRESNAIKATDSATYILAEDKIPESLIGTITSIALNSNMVNADKPLFGFTEAGNGHVKVSARASRYLSLNLRHIVVAAAKAVEGEAGGHTHAAGALISKDRLREFINALEGELIGEES